MLSNTKMDFVAVHNCTSAHVKLMCFDKRKSDVIDHTMIGIAQPPCPHITAAVQVLKKKTVLVSMYSDGNLGTR
jgi:hypothetical protein